MSIAIRHVLNVNVVLAAASATVFGFGTMMGAFNHSITGNRIDGPYSDIEAVEAAGFTASAAPKVHAWAESVFSQKNIGPIAEKVFIGRKAGGDANWTATLDAILAAAGNQKEWFLTTIESRAEADLLLAAAWCEAHDLKIYMAQSSDALVAQETDVTFASTTNAGTYSIHVVDGGDVDITISFVAGGSTTAAAVATALIAAWDADEDAAAIADASNGGSGVVTLNFLAKGRNYTVTTVVVNGTGTPSTITAATGDIGSQLRLANLKCTALWYHAADDHTDGTIPADGYLDGAIAARGGGFQLDSPGGRATWFAKELSGITPDDVSQEDADEFFFQQTNLYADIFGLPRTLKGTMAGGTEDNPRFIDVTVTLMWLKRRLEEGIWSFFAGHPTVVPYTNSGITGTMAEGYKVFAAGVTNGHLSPDHPRVLRGPKVVEVSQGNKIARKLTLSGEVTLAGGIHHVTLNVTVQQ